VRGIVWGVDARLGLRVTAPALGGAGTRSAAGAIAGRRTAPDAARPGRSSTAGVVRMGACDATGHAMLPLHGSLNKRMRCCLGLRGIVGLGQCLGFFRRVCGLLLLPAHMQ